MHHKKPLSINAGEAAAYALYTISRFGWLRATELGRFLSPGKDSSRKYAERLLRKLLSQRYVLSRALPGKHTGNAYVVTAMGTAWLRAHTTAAGCKNGTGWGRLIDGVWTPPAAWRHQLYVAGVLGILYERGYEVVTELELMRMKPNAEKHADGIAIAKNTNGLEQAIWLEVEQSRKSGAHHTSMLRAVFGAARGNPLTYYPTLPPISAGAIAIPISSVDERGYRIDHRARLLNTVEKLGVESAATVTLLEMFFLGEGVGLLGEDALDFPAAPPKKTSAVDGVGKGPG